MRGRNVNGIAVCCAASLSWCAPATAQQFVDTTNTPVVEDFNAGIVMVSGSTEQQAYGRKIVVAGFTVPAQVWCVEAETNTMNNTWMAHAVWNKNPRFVLDSRYMAASQWVGWSTPPETRDPGSATQPFTRNYNGDADSQDATPIGQSGESFGAIDSTILPALGAGNHALYIRPNRHIDTELTLRFVNRTGAEVSKWQISTDAWAHDMGLGNVTFALLAGTSYSTWSPNLTTVASATSGNSAAGWVSAGNLSGTVELSVADGASLYVQMRQTRFNPNGNQNGFAFDNLSVTAVIDPPPGGTVVLLR